MVISQISHYTQIKDGLDLLVINASWTPENFRDPALQLWLRRMSQQSVPLVGIDTGAFVLAFAGLMNGYRTVVHYEHIGYAIPEICVRCFY